MSLRDRLLSASMILSLTLLLGRLAGFAREIQIGALFGISRDGDFAIVMLTTPDLLVNLLLAGGLSAALIPEFGRVDQAGRTKLFLIASLLVAGLFGLITLLIVLFPALLMTAFAPGYSGAPVAEYGDSFRLAALAIPLAGLVGVTSALLNAEEKFFIVGSGTLIFNLAVIAVLAFCWVPDQGLMVLAAGIAAASLLRFGSQVLAATRYLSRQKSQVSATNLTDLARRFLQALGASTLVLLIPVLLRAVVSLNGAGNIAAYNFATKLVELPIGIAITTISVVAFPTISKVLVEGDAAEAVRLYSHGVVRSLTTAFSIAIPCFYFAEPLVSLVFGHGQMDKEDLQLIADMARLGFLTLPMIAISSMSTVMLNARHQTGMLLRLTLLCLLLLPVAVVPGIITGDARLSIATLPLFHLLYAFILAKAVGQPLVGRAQTLVTVCARPALLSAAVTAMFALVVLLIPPNLPLIRSILALGGIGVSVLTVAALTQRAQVV